MSFLNNRSAMCVARGKRTEKTSHPPVPGDKPPADSEQGCVKSDTTVLFTPVVKRTSWFLGIWNRFSHVGRQVVVRAKTVAGLADGFGNRVVMKFFLFVGGPRSVVYVRESLSFLEHQCNRLVAWITGRELSPLAYILSEAPQVETIERIRHVATSRSVHGIHLALSQTHEGESCSGLSDQYARMLEEIALLVCEHQTGNTQQGRKLAPYIGRALHILRLRQYKTQDEIAELLSTEFYGISNSGSTDAINQSYVCRLEKGRVNFCWDRFERVCRILQSSPAKVLQIAEKLASLEEGGMDNSEILKKIKCTVETRLQQHLIN